MKSKRLDDIDSVFGTNPRDGYGPEKYWWGRRKEDKEFFDLLYSRGKSICLDGPTGSGKTSLAMRGLREVSYRYCIVTVSPNLTWRGLCKEIVTIPASHKGSKSLSLNFGLKHLVPSGEVAVYLGKDHTPLSEFEYSDRYLEEFTQHDLARVMQETKTTLFLDDFENALIEIIDRVASLIKILSTSSDEKAAKVVLTAADESFTKLLNSNFTIEKRLVPFNLGGLTEKWQGWDFIRKGLDNLRIINPGNSRFPKQRSRLGECQTAVYDAGGGILKNLTFLGQTLARTGYQRRSITANDILKACDSISERNIRSYSRKYKHIVKLVSEDPVICELLRYLYNKGIGGIHYLYDIVADLDRKFSEDLVRNAIVKLVDDKVLVQTGINGSILFPKNASFLHCFCLACAEPKKYNAPKAFYKNNDQLLLPLDIYQNGL